MSWRHTGVALTSKRRVVPRVAVGEPDDVGVGRLCAITAVTRCELDRYRAGVAQVIEIVLRPGSIEIRFGARRRFAQTLVDWWRRRVSGWREDTQALRLAKLDERILKDIGLGRCAGGSLAGRVHAYRQQELRRLLMARSGLI